MESQIADCLPARDSLALSCSSNTPYSVPRDRYRRGPGQLVFDAIQTLWLGRNFRQLLRHERRELVPAFNAAIHIRQPLKGPNIESFGYCRIVFLMLIGS